MAGRGNPNIQPGPGRPKGSKNKFTTLKQSFYNVYKDLGGDPEFLKWAKLNKRDFYKMLASMLPKEIEITGPDGGDPIMKVVVVEKELTKKEWEAKYSKKPSA